MSFQSIANNLPAILEELLLLTQTVQAFHERLTAIESHPALAAPQPAAHVSEPAPFVLGV